MKERHTININGNMRKILLIGHMRHGKDTLAEMMARTFGYKYSSSSLMACNIFIYDALKRKYGYESVYQCFEDRVNHRAEWHDLICEYNEDDGARLAKEIMKECNMYVGMRSDKELKACLEQKVFDLVIGVYDPRKPLEGEDSFDIDFWNAAQVVIPNAGEKEHLFQKMIKAMRLF